MLDVIYLDFDGVLHPLPHRHLDGSEINRHEPPLPLFCWASILESLLDDFDPHGRIKIVLSTTWAHQQGLEAAAAFLPIGLWTRVSGCTLDTNFCRGDQVAFHAMEHGIERWIALDDNDFEWPAEHLSKLIHCNDLIGISDPRVIAKLKEVLV
jgi:hypothetical protein